MPQPPAPRTYRLHARFLLVVSMLVGLIAASGAAAVITALVARRALLASHELSLASRRAAQLSILAREQYIHEAHTIIVRDRSHVDHHDEWVQKLMHELHALRPGVDAEGAALLDRIREASGDVTGIFSTAILPALDRQDWGEVQRAHDRALGLVERMTAHADALVVRFDQRALKAEADARAVIGGALVATIALGAAAVALALVAGRSLLRSFSTPLSSLEEVARRVASGDRGARVPEVAAAELAIVAGAFNRMLDALASAEAEVVARERLAAVGRVAAGVAHEINNPIAVIRGYLKTMLEEEPAPGRREELLILDEEAAACQRIAEDLLLYVRAPALVPQPVDAAALLAEAAARAGVQPTAVTQAEAATIRVDPLRLRQVIVNLVKNAREATPGEEPVEITGRRRGNAYRIEVLDRGEGIADEARSRLFEPFFSTRRGGTGLGLAVCYGLVTAHGGTIRAEPRDGGGTRFVIDLPDVPADEDGERQGHA